MTMEDKINSFEITENKDVILKNARRETILEIPARIAKILSKNYTKLTEGKIKPPYSVGILNPDLLNKLKPQTILTPHLKELERLIGKWNSEVEQFEKAAAISKNVDCILVMKGAPTYIFSNGKCFENSTGNPALATAGSGDVLTGIITSLLAQNYSAEEAAILGVYIHGLTADLARPEIGTQAFTASTIIEYLGKAFLEIEEYIM